MEAIDKSKELVEKFYDKIEDFDLDHNDPEMSLRMKYAKACALICVEEAINVCPYVDWEKRYETLEMMDAYEWQFVSYWQSVKQEIIKL